MTRFCTSITTQCCFFSWRFFLTFQKWEASLMWSASEMAIRQFKLPFSTTRCPVILRYRLVDQYPRLQDTNLTTISPNQLFITSRLAEREVFVLSLNLSKLDLPKANLLDRIFHLASYMAEIIRNILSHIKLYIVIFQDKFGKLVMVVPEIHALAARGEEHLYQRHCAGQAPTQTLLMEMLHAKRKWVPPWSLTSIVFVLNNRTVTWIHVSFTIFIYERNTF